MRPSQGKLKGLLDRPAPAPEVFRELLRLDTDRLGVELSRRVRGYARGAVVSPDRGTRAWAIEILWLIGVAPGDRQVLVRALRDASPSVRLGAARALAAAPFPVLDILLGNLAVESRAHVRSEIRWLVLELRGSDAYNEALRRTSVRQRRRRYRLLNLIAKRGSLANVPSLAAELREPIDDLPDAHQVLRALANLLYREESLGHHLEPAVRTALRTRLAGPDLHDARGGLEWEGHDDAVHVDAVGDHVRALLAFLDRSGAV